MKTTTERVIAPYIGTYLLDRPFSAFRLPEPTFSPNEDGTPTEAEKAAAAEAARAAAEKAAREAADKKKAELKTKTVDELVELLSKTEGEKADLLKETMARKDKIKQLETDAEKFKGIDPEAYKAALEEKTKLEAAQEEAKRKELEGQGKWQELIELEKQNAVRLVEAQKTEHLRVVGEMQAKIDDLLNQNKGNSSVIEELTVGQSFAGSTYIKDDLLLTPVKARQLYGSHFDIENGKVIGYDKPRGAEKRTKLVTATGEALPFEEAFKRIIEADPDKDSLKKAKMAPGAGSRNQRTGAPAAETSKDTSGLRGVARIKAGFAADAAKVS